MKAGFPPAVIKATGRTTYYDALDHAYITGEEEVYSVGKKSVDESLDLWLSVI